MYKYLLIVFLFSSNCFSETSLWEVSKNGNTVYLGGTIHVLNKKDYPLPLEFSSAFKKSDILVFETDIDKTQTPEFSKKVNEMFTYPAGESLKQAINATTFLKLEKHLSKRDISIDMLLSYKPSMVVIFLTMIELKKLGMVDIGVDQYFHNKAKKIGKSINYFETVDEQLDFLHALGSGNANDVIISTINDMTKMKEMMLVIKSAWLTGNESKMEKVTLTEMMRDYPDLYQTLLVKRNNNWMPHIETMLANPKIEMILVGALHLVGKDGLLQKLRQKGYDVKKFNISSP